MCFGKSVNDWHYHHMALNINDPVKLKKKALLKKDDAEGAQFQCELNFYLFCRLSFNLCLTHSHTMTPFDAPGKQTF